MGKYRIENEELGKWLELKTGMIGVWKFFFIRRCDNRLTVK
jgi:hypothetical protein